MSYYAVRNGRLPGIYQSWGECEPQVKGFSGAIFKKFSTRAEAEVFVQSESNSSAFPLSSNTARVHKAINGPNSWSRPIAPTSSGKHVSVVSSASSNRSLSVANDAASRGSASSSDSSGSRKRRTRRDSSASSTSSDSTDALVVARDEATLRALQRERDHVVVYTDGACSANGRSAASAGIGVYWAPAHVWNVSERLHGRQTNNHAEIEAATRAIRIARAAGIERLEIRTDSEFLISCATAWMKKWEKNGWCKADGQKVHNRRELARLARELAFVSVRWTHVSAHSGLAGNEAADRLAVAGSQLAAAASSRPARRD